ncbi:MAG: hypothetical protein ABW190_09380 [Rhizobacter sp.]
MNTARQLSAALALCVACALAPAAGPPPPVHGGLVTQSAGLELELVATPSTLRLYVRGTAPIPDITKSRARLTLRSGNDQQVAELMPAGDRLEAIGAFVVKPGTEVVANLALPGREAVAAHWVIVTADSLK